MQQLSANGIAFEFLDGVDGRKDRHPLLQRFKPEKFLARHGRPSVPGEAGCYASHFLAWQKCAELNQPVIIMEDDFELHSNAAEAFSLTARLIGDYPFIRLEPTRPKPCYTQFREDRYRLVRYLKVPQRMTCYAIAPVAASAFMRASDEFVYPVDYFIRHQHLHRIPIHGLSPAPVSARRRHESEIGDRHRNKGPLWCRLTKLVYKAGNETLNIMTNLVHYIREKSLVSRQSMRKPA